MISWLKRRLLPKGGPMKTGAVISSRGGMAWQVNAWWWWIPGQGLLVWAWNEIHCWRKGHDYILLEMAKAGYIPMDKATCPNCCRKLTEKASS